MLNKLNGLIDRLEGIQRALEKYLETKRHVFPRFYFISNEDLLEILANSRKPEMIQPHLKKLFSSILSLKMVKVCTTTLRLFSTPKSCNNIRAPFYEDPFKLAFFSPICSLRYAQFYLLVQVEYYRLYLARFLLKIPFHLTHDSPKYLE